MGNTVYVMLHGQRGDIMTAMSVIKYRQELWGNAHIVWYADADNFDLLKYQDIELREFPRGFGYPKMVEEENAKLLAEGKDPVWQDWSGLVDSNNHLDLEMAIYHPSFKDAKAGYFPCAHQLPDEKRYGSYNNIPKRIFGVPKEYEWHPFLKFSDEERQDAKEFIGALPEGRNIFMETYGGSSQSILNEEMVRGFMSRCTEHLGKCNFIFTSHKFLKSQEEFPDDFFINPNIFFCKHFTVRQCALIAEQTVLMLSVSSGISVASSAWGIASPLIIQVCGSKKCSTQDLANGEFHLVTTDNKDFTEMKNEFYHTLNKILNTIK